MHDRPKCTPPEAPGVTRPAVTRAERRAQIILLRSAEEIAAVRTLLWIVHVKLGERPEDSDMGENLIPDSVRVAVRGTIECVSSDCLDPAIRALEETARETPESLARQWRERLAQRGGAL
jgi:hypothetical protein